MKALARRSLLGLALCLVAACNRTDRTCGTDFDFAKGVSGMPTLATQVEYRVLFRREAITLGVRQAELIVFSRSVDGYRLWEWTLFQGAWRTGVGSGGPEPSQLYSQKPTNADVRRFLKERGWFAAEDFVGWSYVDCGRWEP